MSKTSTYPSVETFSAAEKTEFLSNALCIASGSKTAGGDKITANIPFTTFQSAVTAETTYDASSTAPISGMGVADALASFGGFEVTTLDPTTNLPDVTSPSSKIIYLTANGGSATANVYDEWIYSNSAWEKVGATTVDLSNYYTKTEVDNLIPAVPVTDVTVDGTSVLNQGVAEIVMPFARTYAKFEGGGLSLAYNRFDLHQCAEVQFGLNTDNIVLEGSFIDDASLWPGYYYYRVPVAGVYKVSMTLRIGATSQSASISNLKYGFATKDNQGYPTSVVEAYTILDNVNGSPTGVGPEFDVQVNGTLVIEADDVFTPFIESAIVGETFTALVSVVSVEFEKIGVAPSNP